MIVDTCAHVWDNPEQLGPWAAERLRREHTEPWQRPHPTPQALAEALEPVSFAFVHGFHSRLLEADVPVERVSAFISAAPGKCLGIAGVDPMEPGWSERLDEAVEAGMVGVNISPAAQGFHPCHSEAMMLYERCEQQGLLLYLEPRVGMAPQVVMSFADPSHLDEVARTFPTLRMVIGGLGHPWVEPTLMLLRKHEHVWADLAGLVDKPWPLYQAILLARQHRVLERVLLASGFPGCRPEQAVGNLYSINNFALGTQLPTVAREQLRQIVERDALSQLNLHPPAGDSLTQDNGRDRIATSIEAPGPRPPTTSDSVEDADAS